MTELIPAPDPLGLPVPVWILVGFKIFGFFVHLIFMNLWVAGLPTAFCLFKSKPKIADRLLHAMPFFMAFGINAGIVPLLFLQTLYPQFFYPATILQAWFWFLVIPLLLVAYYSVYLASFGKFRVAATLIATVLLFSIGLMFSSAMTLTANPQAWPKIFMETSKGGAVHGAYLFLNPEVILRFLLVVGMAFGTLAAYFVLDAQWFAKNADDKNDLRKLVLLYLLGVFIYGVAGATYALSIEDKLPRFWLFANGGGILLGALLAFSYWRNANRVSGISLIVVQLLVLASNAIARQSVQISELMKWYDPYKAPVRGEWGSFIFFMVTFIVALGILFWIGRTALRRTRSGAI